MQGQDPLLAHIHKPVEVIEHRVHASMVPELCTHTDTHGHVHTAMRH